MAFPCRTLLEIFKSSRISWEVSPAPISTNGLMTSVPKGEWKQSRPDYTNTFGCIFQDWPEFLMHHGSSWIIMVQVYLHYAGCSIQLAPTTHIPWLGSPHTPLPGRVPAPTKYSLTTWHQTSDDPLAAVDTLRSGRSGDRCCFALEIWDASIHLI